jgi:deoxyribonuclease V
MRAKTLHSWQVTVREAIAIQQRLRTQVITESTLGELHYIAGADIATTKDSPRAYAGVVVLSYPSLAVVEARGLEDQVDFPYVPGLLAFREGPLLLKVFEQLTVEPDVLVFDGQGLAHPRGMGIATHLGLVFDKPSIGCAKSRLFGRYQEPAAEKGAWSELRDPQDQLIGAVLRSRAQVTPIFVSIGHRVDLPTAIRVLMACTRGVRIPEPTRLAHNFVTQLRRGGSPPGEQGRLL